MIPSQGKHNFPLITFKVLYNFISTPKNQFQFYINPYLDNLLIFKIAIWTIKTNLRGENFYNKLAPLLYWLPPHLLQVWLLKKKQKNVYCATKRNSHPMIKYAW